jgi:tetraacyldisaccharide 4'-kinase
MNDLRKKIESIMTGPDPAPNGSFAALLYLLSRAYGGLQTLRGACYRQRLMTSKKLPCKVISVGNITVGGTGKTPMTVFISECLKRVGYRVALISRGYKGTAGKTATIISDGQSVTGGPETAGDEPYLLASRLKGIPVVVGQDRFSAGLLALDTFQPEVIVLDDGFQHMQLARDLDLVLLDYHQPFGNRHLLPRGTLREPVSALMRSHALVLTRCPHPPAVQAPSQDAELKAMLPQAPVFSTSHAPYFYRIPPNARCSPAEFAKRGVPTINDIPGVDAGRRSMAFSGIARNDDFLQTLGSAGINVTQFAQFSDHHWYSDRDFTAIQRAAEQSAAQCLVTTEKDYARFAHRKTWPLELIVVGVRISFGGDEARFDSFLQKKLQD